MDTLDTADAARLLHVNVKRVQSLARSGALPAIRVGKRWLFRRAELERLLTKPGRRGFEALPVVHETRPAIALEPVHASTVLETSARNLLRAEVESVHEDGVMAEVCLRVGGQELVSIITATSARRLQLAPGAQVLAMIKSTEVMIARSAIHPDGEP